MRLTVEQEHVIDRVSVNNAYSVQRVQTAELVQVLVSIGEDGQRHFTCREDMSDMSWPTRRQKCIFMMDREPRADVMISLRGVRQRRPDSVREISRQATHDILAHLPKVCVLLAVAQDTRQRKQFGNEVPRWCASQSEAWLKRYARGDEDTRGQICNH